MMVANSSNLLLTICPANQCNNVVTKSQQAAPPLINVRHQYSNDVIDNYTSADDTDNDEVCDHLRVSRLPCASGGVRRETVRRQSRSNSTKSATRDRRVMRL